MADFCYFLLANGVFATVLALVVCCASRWIKHPAVLHLLWVLVLLRLMMPPIMILDMSEARGWIARIANSSSEQQATLRESIGRWELVAAVTTAVHNSSLVPTTGFPPRSRSLAVGEQNAPPSSLLASSRRVLQQTLLHFSRAYESALCIVFTIWSVGTMAFLILQTRRALLFHSSVKKQAYGSRVWQQRTENVARSMGLRSCPEIRLVRAKISPMLWGFGLRTKLLFPEKLLQSLHRRAQNTLIAHELAHYRRGDQFVRLLELAATACFWWHPVLWWSRSEIERTEEQCCDAVAVRLSAGRPRTYAEALLATVDFVSSSALPPVSSAASHSSFLRQRLLAIMQHPLAGQKTHLPDSYPSVLILAAMVLIPSPAFWPAAVKPAVKPTVTSRPALLDTVTSSLQPDVRLDEPGNRPLRLTIDEASRAVLTNSEEEFEVDFGVGVVGAASFSHHGELLAIGTLNGQIRLVSCQTGSIVQQYQVGNAAIHSVDFSARDDVLAVGTRDGTCRLIGLEKNSEEQVKRCRRGWQVTSVRFSQSGRYAAVVWSRRSLQHFEIWDLVSGRVANTKLDLTRVVAAVDVGTATSPDWCLVHRDGGISQFHNGIQTRRLDRRMDAPTVREIRVAASPPAQHESLSSVVRGILQE